VTLLAFFGPTTPGRGQGRLRIEAERAAADLALVLTQLGPDAGVECLGALAGRLRRPMARDGA
jgi:hypothetical protein